MRLYEEILRRLGGGESDVFSAARYTVLPGRGGYFQGIKSVSEFSPCRVVLCMKGGALEIDGAGFVIGKYCDGDMELEGKIVGVKWVENC